MTPVQLAEIDQAHQREFDETHLLDWWVVMLLGLLLVWKAWQEVRRRP